MKVLHVSCNNCGAPLEVPHKTRFLTCKFCESRLEIQKSESAYFTSVIEAVHEVKSDVETIKMQNELERVDREWSMEREGFMRTDQHGRRHVPSTVGATVIMILAVAGGALFVSAAPGGFGAFGFIFIAVGIMIGLSTMNRAKQYEGRKERYESKRRELTHALRDR